MRRWMLAFLVLSLPAAAQVRLDPNHVDTRPTWTWSMGGVTIGPSGGLSATTGVFGTLTAPVTNLTGTLAVGHGGTGGSTAAAARTALGVPGLSGNNTLAGSNDFTGAFISDFSATFNGDVLITNGAATGKVLTAQSSDGTTAWSDVAPILPDYRNEKGIGGYKLDTGLDRFFRALGNTGAGMGGVDIPIEGDSLDIGVNSTDFYYKSWPFLVTRMLQAAYNPPGVVGGYGYLPLSAGLGHDLWPGVPGAGSNQYLWTAVGSGWTLTDGGTANRRVAATDSGRVALNVFDGTAADAVALRKGVTSLQIVGAQGPAVGNWLYDVSTAETGAYTAGTGNAATGAVAGGGTLQWGNHWPMLTGLDARNRNNLQITTPATGATLIDGVIAYNGDEAAGVRVHRLARSGTTAGDYSDSVTVASNDVFGSASGGATNGKLWIMDWITNETIQSISPSLFATTIGARIDDVLALPSAPSVLYIIPFKATSWDTATAARFDALKAEVYAVCDARAHVAVLDLNAAFGNDSANYSSLLAGDGIHWNDTGQEVVARLVGMALGAGGANPVSDVSAAAVTTSTTTALPSAPAAGTVRWNTTTNRLQVYTGTEWSGTLHTPTLVNSWAQIGTYSAPYYWKDAEGVVHLQGVLNGGASASNVFQLPVGYRTSDTHVYLVANGTSDVRVQADGWVYCATNGGFVSLDDITFLATQ